MCDWDGNEKKNRIAIHKSIPKITKESTWSGVKTKQKLKISRKKNRQTEEQKNLRKNTSNRQ